MGNFGSAGVGIKKTRQVCRVEFAIDQAIATKFQLDCNLAVLALLLSGLLLAALSGLLLAALAGLLVLLSGLLLPAATLLTALAGLLVLLPTLTALVLSALIGVVHILPVLSVVTPLGVSTGQIVSS